MGYKRCVQLLGAVLDCEENGELKLDMELKEMIKKEVKHFEKARGVELQY